jgi:hypothetical protein
LGRPSGRSWQPLGCAARGTPQAGAARPGAQARAAPGGRWPRTSVHISLTFSRIMLQCLSNALTRARSLWLLRQLMSTCASAQASVSEPRGAAGSAGDPPAARCSQAHGRSRQRPRGRRAGAMAPIRRGARRARGAAAGAGRATRRDRRPGCHPPQPTCVLLFTLVVSTESGPVRNSSSSFFSRSSTDMGAAVAIAPGFPLLRLPRKGWLQRGGQNDDCCQRGAVWWKGVAAGVECASGALCLVPCAPEPLPVRREPCQGRLGDVEPPRPETGCVAGHREHAATRRRAAPVQQQPL